MTNGFLLYLKDPKILVIILFEIFGFEYLKALGKKIEGEIPCFFFPFKYSYVEIRRAFGNKF